MPHKAIIVINGTELTGAQTEALCRALIDAYDGKSVIEILDLLSGTKVQDGGYVGVAAVSYSVPLSELKRLNAEKKSKTGQDHEVEQLRAEIAKLMVFKNKVMDLVGEHLG